MTKYSSSITPTLTKIGTKTQEPLPTLTEYLSPTLEGITPTENLTLDYFSFLKDFNEEVKGLKDAELDQAFFLPTVPREVTIPLNKAGQSQIMGLLTKKYSVPEEFNEVTIEAIKAAAKIINEQAGQNLVNLEDKVSFLDKRNTVSIGVNTPENKQISGTAFFNHLDYFTGSYSDLSEQYMVKQCLAKKTEIKDQEFLKCVTTAMHEMMHLFGINDLSVNFNAAQDFYSKMDQNCAHNSGKGKMGASIMYYPRSAENKGQHCFQQGLTLDENGKVKLSILDEKLIQRMKEKGNEIQAFELIRGISSGFINTLLYDLMNTTIYHSLSSKCIDPLWQKLGVEKNERNVEIASHIIGFAVSFAVVTSTVGLIPAAGSQARILLGNIGGKILKERLDEAFPNFSGVKTDFILKNMLPCVLLSTGVGAANLNVKNTANSVINALGAMIGGVSASLLFAGVVKGFNSIRNRRNQRNQIEPDFEGVVVTGESDDLSGYNPSEENEEEKNEARQAESTSQKSRSSTSSDPIPLILEIEKKAQSSSNKETPKPSIRSPAALKLSSNSEERSH